MEFEVSAVSKSTKAKLQFRGSEADLAAVIAHCPQDGGPCLETAEGLSNAAATTDPTRTIQQP